MRTLLAESDAPRFFGSAWRDDSPSPFKTAWLLEIIDQKDAQEIPVPEDDFSRPLEADHRRALGAPRRRPPLAAARRIQRSAVSDRAAVFKPAS